MADKLRAGIIGCGNRGKAQARGYLQSDKVDLVACCDISKEGAEAAAEELDILKVYTDSKEMLEKEHLDILTIALWTGLHHDAVMEALNCSHPPKLINNEKPMAPTFGEAKKMHEAAEKAGVMMTFSHQRRMGPTFSKVKELLDAGTVGDLTHIQMHCSNLFDWGTHWFDMMNFYNNNEPAQWVMGQVDMEGARPVFNTMVEGKGLSYITWKNGVTGLLATGRDDKRRTDFSNRVIGTKGIIDVRGKEVHVLAEGENWKTITFESADPCANDTVKYILESIDSLEAGKESLFSSRKALEATELIFATYESSRSRCRVHLPLDIEDSPLLSMIENGDLKVPE